MDINSILAKLKSQISANEYQQYANKLIFDSRKSTHNKFIFHMPNRLLLNWAKKKYTGILSSIIEQEIQQKPEIIFSLTTQQAQATMQSQQKYLIKNNQAYINKDNRFDNFIVGACNELAFKTAKDLVNEKAIWNPFLIYGNTGLGKTHLLNAIANEVFHINPNANIVSITAETMFNEWRIRIDNNAMDQFRERFRKCDYLLIDDIQFLSGKTKFQIEFFNTFNEIVNTKGKIVMTSDKLPKHIKDIDDRLKSRFDGGMMVKVESPELETKINIIKQKFELNKISLDSQIINFLATQFHDNIREIEGIIMRLYANMSLLNIPITIDTIKHILKDKENEHKEITFDDIVRLVALEYSIRPTEIKTKVRGKKHIALARKIVAYIARQETTITLPAIASELNLKDHSAVSKQIKAITEEMQKDSKLNTQVQNLASKLKQNQQKTTS